jgi:hypothetical protein
MTNRHESQSEMGTVDDAFRHLRGTGLSDDRAIWELNQKFVQGDRLRLRFRRTDAAGQGQEGDIHAGPWGTSLRVARDHNSNPSHGPIDFATGAVTAKNDGRAFVEVIGTAPMESGRTYELMVLMPVVRTIWSALTGMLAATEAADSGVIAGRTKKGPSAFVQLVAQILDALKEQGIAVDTMRAPKLRELVAEQLKKTSPGSTVSERTLSNAQALRRDRLK